MKSLEKLILEKKSFDENDLRCFDFFEVDIGMKMSLRGNIRIANAELWNWVIDGQRASYSIYPLSNYLRDIFRRKRNKAAGWIQGLGFRV